MSSEIFYLLLTAVSISLLHTVTGPDHYVPLIVLARSNNWTVKRTIFITILCGLGHVGSSVVLGLGGVALGWSLSKVSWLENVRGGIAAWLMFVLGIIYIIYALVQLNKNKLHKHFDVYDNDMYVYEHRHGVAMRPGEKTKVTPWVIFIVFVLGPCEPLIPLLSFPAASQSVFGITLLLSVFTFFTLITMVVMVLLGYHSISFFNSVLMQKYVHVTAASAIIICGAGMLFMGW